MPRTGIAYLPLHGGTAPRWLFQRMVRLSREITLVIVEEFGPREMLARLSDPHWFQAFGCLLGFDWHSSGLTTVVCGALKQALQGMERDSGLFIAGGKGATSRKTPGEITAAADRHSFEPRPLVYASRMSAKVDSAALQDGYQVYHHTFLWTPGGDWAVVQQGMNPDDRYARRYHWLSDSVSDFVVEPHKAIMSDRAPTGRRHSAQVLNMVAVEAGNCRDTSVQLSRQDPEKTIREIKRLQSLEMPSRHHLHPSDVNPERLEKAFRGAYESNPGDFEELLGTEGVGPKAIRALALLSDLVYGAKASFRDPARFSFAHGGKDGVPYPVDRATYDRSIEVLREALRRARIGRAEKLQAMRRLAIATTSGPP